MAAIDVTVPNRPTVEITHPNVVIGNCADGSATNSDGSFTIAVPSGVDVPLPNINFTDSDGTTTSVPSVQDIVATACGATGGTLTIGVYSDAGHTTPITSADFGDTVYIKSTVTGITPTEYRFFVFETASNGVATVQVGNSISYDITSFNDLVIYAEAKDASVAAASVTAFEVTINSDADANAFINAHNTASGQTMAAPQQQVIQGLFQRLKGAGTTFGSDLWTKLKTSGARIFPYTPVDDSTVSIPAYGLDMIQLESQSFHGFLPSDFKVTGLTGGSGKYTKTGLLTTSFNINNIGGNVYSRTSLDNAAIFRMSFGTMTSDSWSSATDGYSLWPRFSGSIFVHSNSGWVGSVSTVNSLGLLAQQRNSSSNIDVYQNGLLAGTLTKTSVAQCALEIYGHAMNSTVGALYPDPSELAWLCPAMPSLTDNEMADYYEVVKYYQENIITGGRHVL